MLGSPSRLPTKTSQEEKGCPYCNRSTWLADQDESKVLAMGCWRLEDLRLNYRVLKGTEALPSTTKTIIFVGSPHFDIGLCNKNQQEVM